MPVPRGLVPELEPYTCAEFYKLGDTLVITGPSRAGKTLLISVSAPNAQHIIFDLLRTQHLTGKVVLIDTSFSFDFETLKSKLDAEVGDAQPQERDGSGTAEAVLGNLMYLPVKNLTDFKLIVKSLQHCLEKRELSIHALLIDSATTVVSWTFVENSNRGYAVAFNSVVKRVEELCKKHSVLLVYTKKPTSNLKLTSFYVQLRQAENHALDDLPKAKRDESQPGPEEGEPGVPSLALVPVNTGTPDDESSFEKEFYPASLEKMLVDQDNPSNDEKSDEEPEGMDCGPNEADAHNPDGIRIKSCIPDSWTKPNHKDPRKDRMALFMSFSRCEDKNFITFISRNNRTRAEEPKVISVCNVSDTQTQTGESQRTVRARTGSQNGGDCALNGTSQEESQVSLRGGLDLSTGTVSGPGEVRVFDADELRRHDFRVYRIDSTTTFTLCEHDPLDINASQG